MMHKVDASSSKIDAKIIKVLAYFLVSHIVAIGVLYYGAMNLIVK